MLLVERGWRSERFAAQALVDSLSGDAVWVFWLYLLQTCAISCVVLAWIALGPGGQKLMDPLSAWLLGRIYDIVVLFSVGVGRSRVVLGRRFCWSLDGCGSPNDAGKSSLASSTLFALLSIRCSSSWASAS